MKKIYACQVIGRVVVVHDSTGAGVSTNAMPRRNLAFQCDVSDSCACAVFKVMNFVFKMMDFVLKTMNLQGRVACGTIATDGDVPSFARYVLHKNAKK